MIVCNPLAKTVLILVFVCLLHTMQQRGHYSCLMAHFLTSACCSPEVLRLTLISPFFPGFPSSHDNTSVTRCLLFNIFCHVSPFFVFREASSSLSALLVTAVVSQSYFLSSFSNLASLLSQHHVGNHDDNCDGDDSHHLSFLKCFPPTFLRFTERVHIYRKCVDSFYLSLTSMT